MHRTITTLLSLTCALTICGCAATGKAVLPPPSCPQPPQPPPELMAEPNFEHVVRLILFEPAPNATPESVLSNPPSAPTPEAQRDPEH